MLLREGHLGWNKSRIDDSEERRPADHSALLEVCKYLGLMLERRWISIDSRWERKVVMEERPGQS